MQLSSTFNSSVFTTAQTSTQSPSITENYGVVQSVQSTTSTNFDISQPVQTQASIATTYNVPPPIPVQHPINFNIPPPVIKSGSSSLPPSSLLPSVNRNGVEIWAPNANVLMAPPNLSAPPPLIISSQLPILNHQHQDLITPSSHNTVSPVSNDVIISADLVPPPGASTTSSSSSSSSPSSCSSRSSSNRNNKENGVKKSDELNSAWETLLKRTESVSDLNIFTFQLITYI